MRTQRFTWALTATLLASCGSYGAPDSVVFGEAVYTQPKTGFDFRGLSTFYLSPNMTVKDDNATSTQPVPDPIAAAIRSHMAALGYTENTQPPGGTDLPPPGTDVGIKLSLLRGTGAVYYPGYWCNYWTYYGCYYNWYYAGSYRFGSIVMEMGDLRNSTPGQNLQMLWTAMMYGVATTSSVDVQRGVDAVNRAFEQSPYLATH